MSEMKNKLDDGNPAGLKAGGAVAVALGVAAGALYAWTMSIGASPGAPSRALTGTWKDVAWPTGLDAVWGALCGCLGGVSGATWLSVACGAACVALLAWIATGLRYAVHDRKDEDETARERQGRWVCAVTAGLYLALSVPTWVGATRTLPDMFHLAWLLAAMAILSGYQRAGGAWKLSLLGAVAGAGLAEFPTFWILSPLLAVLVARAQLLRGEFRWKTTLAAGAWALLAAVAMYAWAASRLVGTPMLSIQGVDGFWRCLWWFLKQQGRWLFVATHGTGFLLSMSLTLVPWAVVFLLRSKKPAWRHSGWTVTLRVMVLAACLSALWGAKVTAWHFFGEAYLMVTPVAILAACTGYVAGEFWVMGQTREHREAGVGHALRKTFGVIGALLPLSVLAAGVWNLPVADGRAGAPVSAAVADAVSRLDGVDTVLGDGALDDMLMLEAAERSAEPPVVVTAPATGVAAYRKWMALHFTEPREQALLDLGFGPFVQDYLRGPARDRAVLLGGGEAFRDLGEPVPDGLLTRLAGEKPSGGALEALAASQRPFWEEAAEIGAPDAASGWFARRARGNPAQPFRQYVRISASKQANNVAFLLLDEGRAAEGEELLVLARRIAPENPSVLLNLLTLARERGETNTVYEAEWEDFMADHRDDRALWSLADRFGYVRNAGMLIRQGMMWAVSGKPRLAEAELRRSQRGGSATEASPALKAFLGRMYMFSNDLEKGEEFYREILAENPDDADAIYALAKADIQRGETEAAKEKLSRLEAMGVPPGRLALERALLRAAEGDPRGALRDLSGLSREQPDNPLVPALIAFLAQETGNDELLDKTIEGLRRRPNKTLQLRLFLAQLLLGRQDWAGARGEIEPLTRMNPANPKVWELLLRTDYAERKRELAEDHVRVLLTLEPENALGNLLLASFQRERGQLALAESSYRTALKVDRRPETLNDLADLLLRKGRDGHRDAALDEAAALLDEALAAQPGSLTALATRAELHLTRGNLDAAEADIQRVLAAVPESPEALLLSARLCLARGNLSAAADLAATLEARKNAMPPETLEQFKAFQAELKKSAK